MKQRKKGRPKSERKISVGVKLFADEKERGFEIATSQRLSFSEYCRQAILERIKVDEESKNSN